MNNLVTFNFENNNIRTINKDNEPYFCLADLCKTLQIGNPSDVKRRLDDGVVSIETILDSLGRMQNTAFVNEDGLYDVILESRKPEAKVFRKWITGTVIPSIRKTGSYSVNPTLPQTYAEALEHLLAQVKQNQQLHQQIEADHPKVAFANAVSASKDCILVRELAKLLNQNGVNIGEKRLYQWLKDNGYLFKHRNEPTQKAMNLGLFNLKETLVQHADGASRIHLTPKVTPKGQQYFINKLTQIQQGA